MYNCHMKCIEFCWVCGERASFTQTLGKRIQSLWEKAAQCQRHNNTDTKAILIELQ